MWEVLGRVLMAAIVAALTYLALPVADPSVAPDVRIVVAAAFAVPILLLGEHAARILWMGWTGTKRIIRWR